MNSASSSLGAAVMEWVSSWLAERGSRVSSLRLKSEIGFLLQLSRHMTERLLKRREILKTIEPNPNLVQVCLLLFA